MALTIKYQKGVLTIAKGPINANLVPFVKCRPYDKAHAQAIAKRFEAWDKLGWPYIPKG